MIPRVFCFSFSSLPTADKLQVRCMIDYARCMRDVCEMSATAQVSNHEKMAIIYKGIHKPLYPKGFRTR